MYSNELLTTLGDYKITGNTFRYTSFIPKLYNLCKEMNFEKSRILPSRAFCVDENQGFPTTVIKKHFGIFPFIHGLGGGVFATDRHKAYSHHGNDFVIIHASHVGYDPVSKEFGTYKRLQTKNAKASPTCGKICAIINWYQKEYEFAKNRIFLQLHDNEQLISIDNQFLKNDREEGLFLNLSKLIRLDDGGIAKPFRSYSTSKAYKISDYLKSLLKSYEWKGGKGEKIDDKLFSDLFYFIKKLHHKLEGHDHLERNLIDFMPHIVSSRYPALTAAMITTQIEFDRASRSIAQETEYNDKKILYVSGLNIDISPKEGQLFPLTEFVPWAAYFQDSNGYHYTLEQHELVEKLRVQSEENPDQIDLEEAIKSAISEEKITIDVD
ncbi:MAG: hypothetical protein OEV44_05515 [Spirochaetota bacterium]|nr:hypothetical protein [Spirochaetota bacterium]